MPRRTAFLERLADLQHRRAGTVVLLGLLSAALAMPLVLQLGLNSSLIALLPRSQPSVRDMEKIEGRVGGLSTLTVAVQSPEKSVDAMQRFASDLVPRLESLEGHGVRSVEWNVAAYERFVAERKHLYAELGDLKEIRDALKERLEYERVSANPFYVQLDDEQPPDPAQIIDDIRERTAGDREKLEKYPGGYYIHPDRDLLAVFLRTDIKGGDVASAEALMDAVREEVDALGPTSYADDLRVKLAGDLLHQHEEHQAIAGELVLATSLTIVLVLLSIYLFFRSLRAIPVLGLALAAPTLLTFAFAEVAVDYLNTSTAFLGSIVVGNGINPNIIWLSRYFESRRSGLQGTQAILDTHRGTWLATFTASLAAAFAYASLIITDFRGFRDFGIIGGVGMLLCWLGALGLLPALLAWTERLKPLRLQPRASRANLYGALFARWALRAPRPILMASAALGVAGAVIVAWAIYHDPLEYDFRNLRSVREASSEASRINGRVKQIVGGSGAGQAIAVLVPERADTAALRDELTRIRDEEDGAFGKIHTIDELLPAQQEAKLPVLADIRALMLELRPYASAEQRQEIDANLPPADPKPVHDADLPIQVARSFTERDGTRGTILLVEQNHARSTWDGRYLVDWSESLRKARLPDGTRPPLAGRAPVFADMIEVVWRDGPKAIGVSFLATLLLVSIAFRKTRQRVLSIFALLLGIVWMGGTMALAGMRLNFLNFVAFPITFGNGVDYGVNVMRRYDHETRHERVDVPEAVQRAIGETGGAVALCSLTTIIGYSSLYVSANRALNSFGAAMAISEVTCLLAAVLAMPAALLWLGERDRRQRAHAGSSAPGRAMP